MSSNAPNNTVAYEERRDRIKDHIEALEELIVETKGYLAKTQLEVDKCPENEELRKKADKFRKRISAYEAGHDALVEMLSKLNKKENKELKQDLSDEIERIVREAKGDGVHFSSGDSEPV
jgi:predicted  nucleic acid-binding Zn-ribbon protein